LLLHSLLLLLPLTCGPSLFAQRQFGVILMILFDPRHFPAQFLKPLIFARSKDLNRTRDEDKSESKEKFVSTVLLFCILAAGLYGEILRYSF
jgi:hypothetical protein